MFIILVQHDFVIEIDTRSLVLRSPFNMNVSRTITVEQSFVEDDTLVLANSTPLLLTVTQSHNGRRRDNSNANE